MQQSHRIRDERPHLAGITKVLVAHDISVKCPCLGDKACSIAFFRATMVCNRLRRWLGRATRPCECHKCGRPCPGNTARCRVPWFRYCLCHLVRSGALLQSGREDDMAQGCLLPDCRQPKCPLCAERQPLQENAGGKRPPVGDDRTHWGLKMPVGNRENLYVSPDRTTVCPALAPPL